MKRIGEKMKQVQIVQCSQCDRILYCGCGNREDALKYAQSNGWDIDNEVCPGCLFKEAQNNG